MDIKIKRQTINEEPEEEGSEEKLNDWDMPVSGGAGEIRNEEKFQHLNISKFQDARPKVHEVVVKVEFPKMLNYWRIASRWSLILLAALAPIFFLPFTSLPVAANKEILVFILILVSLFASLGRILIEGRIRYPGHPITAAFLVLVLTWGISAFFSISQINSLIGLWSTPDSFFSILLFSVLTLSVAITFNRRDIIISILALLASLSVLGIFEPLQLAKIYILPFTFTKNAIFNPVGSVNDLGVLMAFGLIIVSGLISSFETSKILKKLLGAAAAIFLINLAIIDFWAIWVGLSFAMVFMIGFLSSGLQSSIRQTDSPNRFTEPEKFGESGSGGESVEYQGLQLAYFQKAWLPLVILLVSLLLLIIPSPLAKFIETPLEVSPGYSATLNVALENLKSGHYFLGSGPNTFSYIFNLYKSASINQTVFWSTTFNSGASALATWAGTVGVLGIISLLFIIAAFIWTGIAAGTVAKNTPKGLMNVVSQSVFTAVIFIFIIWFLHIANFTAMALIFWGMGIFLAVSLFEIRRTDSPNRFRFAKPKLRFGESVAIFTSPFKTFLFSFLIMSIMVGSAALAYFEINRYIAEIYFGKATVASAESGQVTNGEAISSISRAIEFWPYDERYFEAMSKVIFIEVSNLVQRKDLPQEALRSQFQNLTSSAISYGQKAKNLNPQNPFNSALLGSIYENLIPFIADASNFAASSYETATALDPKNPSNRLALARVEIARANSAVSRKAGTAEVNDYLDKALANLEAALNLKGDYAPARFLEVQVYDREGKLDAAIRRAEELAMLNNSDVGILFQLGFLYYKAGSYDKSRQVLEGTIKLSPNYSNARYFLGLVYDRDGNREQAIEQFSKIAELNQDNSEVKQILANLKSKKPALFGITPPALAPQNRSEAPVSEDAKQPVQKLKK